MGNIDNFVSWAGHIHTLFADQNYYDNLYYCIYLCSNFVVRCRQKLITYLI